MKMISKFIFWLCGWKVVGDVPKELGKFIMIAAPHTSNWDLLYARGAFYIMDINVRYTIKKELFFFPLGWFLRAMGGIPIDRKSKSNMIDKMIALYDDYDELCILITPEATRSHSKEWKKGFYHIANGANIPISLGYLDYKKKHAGVGPLITPSGDYEKDIKVIKDFYREITPKYPEKGVL